jgi:GNAT superfamily N-acetyltransferase
MEPSTSDEDKDTQARAATIKASVNLLPLSHERPEDTAGEMESRRALAIDDWYIDTGPAALKGGKVTVVDGTPGVRKATLADRVVVADTLASAFAEDPVCCWMCGQVDSERRMTPFWQSLARTGLRKPEHEIYLSNDGSSVAIWRGIDQWKLPPSDIVRSVPAMVSSLRLRLPIALQLLGVMEKAHPTEPHYYLEFLGTKRERQGHGGGSAVMSIMLERCDIEGVPAYLESSNPRNIPFYARHGFVERGVVPAPRHGPVLTAMWRDPRS